MVHNAVLVIWGTLLATVTIVTAKIKLLLFLSLGFFFLLHQVVSSCCLASSQSQAGSCSARILSAFVFYGFTDHIFLQKVLPRAISAALCLLMLHHLSAFLWSDPVWCCWMWDALIVQSTSGKRQWRKKSREIQLFGWWIWFKSAGAKHVTKVCVRSSGSLPG